MTEQERRAWAIVSSLFVTLMLVFGSGYNTAGIFFTPLLKSFGWSRATVSSLQSVLALAAGLCTPLVGYLLDRVEARVVMVAGALLAGLGFLLASSVHSFPPMLLAYVLLGFGIGAGTLLPASLVIANWFGAQRGLAMGITMAGTSGGGMVMALVADRAIGRGGWRAGYLTLALPMFLIVAPLVYLVVRTRPPTSNSASVAQQSETLPGLEVKEALGGRSFWMIALAQFGFAFSVAGAGLHTVPYLIGRGYSAPRAALVLSLVLGMAGVGKLLMGLFADRAGGRTALAVNMTITAAGLLLLFGAGSTALIVLFVVFYGLTVGAPLALVPVVMAESLGLKRFGSLSGLTGLFQTAGAAIGPLLAGWMFDRTGSYATVFELFSAVLVLAALAAYSCVPLPVAEPQARPMAAPA